MRPIRVALSVGAAAALVVGAAGVSAAVTDHGIVDGVAYLSESGYTVHGTPLTLDIPCPGLKQPTGGGFQLIGSQIHRLRAAYPIDLTGDGRVDGWRMVTELSTPDGGYGTDAHLICRGGARTYVTTRGSLPEGTPGGLSLTASCPSDMHVTGGGAVAASAAGAAVSAQIRTSHPVDGADADTIPDDGWRARFFGTKQPGTRVIAICAATNQKYIRRDGTFPGIGSGFYIQCPTDRHVLGVGGKIGGPAGEASVPTMYPIDGFEGNDNEDVDLIPDDNGSMSFSNFAGDPKPGSGWVICSAKVQ